MPAKDGFQLMDGDVALLHSVHQLRLATIHHLAALSGRSQKATPRPTQRAHGDRHPPRGVYRVDPCTAPLLDAKRVEGPALWDSVAAKDEQGSEIMLPVRPDAWMTLQNIDLPDGKNKFHFLSKLTAGRRATNVCATRYGRI
jgi:hypothetical protein